MEPATELTAISDDPFSGFSSTVRSGGVRRRYRFIANFPGTSLPANVSLACHDELVASRLLGCQQRAGYPITHIALSSDRHYGQ